jgi:hypothetical protein
MEMVFVFGGGFACRDVTATSNENIITSQNDYINNLQEQVPRLLEDKAKEVNETLISIGSERKQTVQEPSKVV